MAVGLRSEGANRRLIAVPIARSHLRAMGRTGRVLFVCEHGAAKSVIAAAHFERLAAARGLEASASSRGTDPDPAYPPHVVTGLAADGLLLSEDAPRRLKPGDFAGVTHVVTFCAVTIPDGVNPLVQSWDDVPAVSDGYAAARDVIVRRVEGLLESLAFEKRQS